MSDFIFDQIILFDLIRRKEIKNYNEIPNKFRNKNISDAYVLEGGGKLSEIPKNHVTKGLCERLVMQSAEGLKQIIPGLPVDVPYTYFVEIAVKRDLRSINHIEDKFATDEVIKAAAEADHNSLLYAHLELLSQDTIDFLVSNYPSGHSVFSDRCVKDYALRAALIKEIVKFSGVNNSKRHVVDELVADGFWPSYCGKHNKPSDLESAVFSIVGKEVPWDMLLAYRSFIKSHPIKSVINSMSTDDRIKELMEIYSFDQIEPFILTTKLKNNADMKSRLLEYGLGL